MSKISHAESPVGKDLQQNVAPELAYSPSKAIPVSDGSFQKIANDTDEGNEHMYGQKECDSHAIGSKAFSCITSDDAEHLENRRPVNETLSPASKTQSSAVIREDVTDFKRENVRYNGKFANRK